MWILALHDRLYWLLPNRKYVVGRSSTKAHQEVHLPVKGDSSVSRKHLTLEVRNPTEDAVLHPSIRSDLIITDLESRYGTTVDGVQLESGETRRAPLTPNGMFSIKLGAGTRLRLKWQAFVVTYSTGQSGDAHKTLWEHALTKLKSLDVKLMPYIVKSTDVFVKTGKSTSSLYYALCKQIPVANTQFFEALEEAAHAASDHGVVDKAEVVPDVTPFSPDPKWVPNTERAICLQGFTFYISVKEYAEALEPVLVAAGAVCVKEEQADAIYISPQNSIEQEVPTGKKYVLETEIFTAISEARPLRSEDIRIKTSIRAGTRTRTKPNILQVMTSQSTKPQSGRVQKAPISRRSRQPRILELMVSQDPSQNTQSPSLTSTIEPSHSLSPPESANANVGATANASATPSTSTDRGKPNANNTAKKREPPETGSSSRTKKRKVKPTIPDDDMQQENSDDEEEHVEIDLDAIGEVAIVENSLSARPTQSKPSTAKKDTGPAVKNFKAFKKAQRVTPQKSHIDFAYIVPGAENELQTERAEDEDEDFFNDTKGNNTLAGHNSGSDSMIDLAQRTAAKPENDKEESLFVHSQIDSDDDDFSSGNQRNQKFTQPSAQADDFAFSFT